MIASGYDDFPPIEIVEVRGKQIVIDGHHRARAAGAAGIDRVPVIVRELPPGVGLDFYHQAIEAAEDLGTPF